MSQMPPCPKCGSLDSTMGYGFAAGPLGAYMFCDGCDELLMFDPDTDGLEENEAKAAKDKAAAHYKSIWGDKVEPSGA